VQLNGKSVGKTNWRALGASGLLLTLVLITAHEGADASG
jgi:hypothetical protein